MFRLRTWSHFLEISSLQPLTQPLQKIRANHLQIPNGCAIFVLK